MPIIFINYYYYYYYYKGGYLAKLMGLPIARMICATNSNDIVHRTISAGDMSMSDNVATHSPAMDIQFAYNVERMLFYMCSQDPLATASIMKQVDLQFSQTDNSQGARLDPLLVLRMQELFTSCSVTDEETLRTIQTFQRESNFSLCPHSAIGVHAAQTIFRSLTASTPTFCVLTANPAKFEGTFEAATGSKPVMSGAVKKLSEMPTRFKKLVKSDGNWRQEWISALKGDILSSK
jgi:threonine synthase